MLKRVFFSGVLGFLAILCWTFVANVVIGLTPRLMMNRVGDEARVYDMLRESVPGPGAYVVNPPAWSEGAAVEGQPVFSVTYAGFGHEAAGRMALIEAMTTLISALLAAVILSMTSQRVLGRYASRALFVGLLGLFLGVAGDFGRFGIGGYPLSAALLLAANTVVSWTLAGLVIAAICRPHRALPVAGQVEEPSHADRS